MLTRFLIWICLLIQRVTANSKSGVVKHEVPETLKQLEKIKQIIGSTPSEIKELGLFDPLLYKLVETKFNDIGHIFKALHVFKTSLGEQINDPAVSKPIEDESIDLSSRGNKTLMLAYFQTQNGSDVTLKATYPVVEKCVDDLIRLYTLIIYHPDIDEDYLPYLDRRINPLLRELVRYTETIKNLGTSTHV